MTISMQVLIGLLLGGLTGIGYFWLLWRSVRSLAQTQSPWRPAILGIVLRLSVLFGSFSGLVLLGAEPWLLIGWLAGFLLVRLFAVQGTLRRSIATNEGTS